MTAIAIRAVVVLLSTWAAAEFAAAIELPKIIGAAGGAALAGLAVWLETRAACVPVERLFWGSLGGFFGLIGGLAIGTAAVSLIPTSGMAGLGLPAFSALILAPRSRSGVARTSSRCPRAVPGGARRVDGRKILDTSVIIDGRIADVCETGFVEGTLVVPQFVCKSCSHRRRPRSLRRARGKRGFEIIERLQRMPKVKVEVTELDFSQIREVDGKLMELARALSARSSPTTRISAAWRSSAASRSSTSTSWPRRSGRLALPASRCGCSWSGKAKKLGRVSDSSATGRWWWSTGATISEQTVEVTVTSVLQTTAAG